MEIWEVRGSVLLSFTSQFLLMINKQPFQCHYSTPNTGLVTANAPYDSACSKVSLHEQLTFRSTENLPPPHVHKKHAAPAK